VSAIVAIIVLLSLSVESASNDFPNLDLCGPEKANKYSGPELKNPKDQDAVEDYVHECYRNELLFADTEMATTQAKWLLSSKSEVAAAAGKQLEEAIESIKTKKTEALARWDGTVCKTKFSALSKDAKAAWNAVKDYLDYLVEVNPGKVDPSDDIRMESNGKKPKVPTAPKASTPPKAPTPPKASTSPKASTPPKAPTPPTGLVSNKDHSKLKRFSQHMQSSAAADAAFVEEEEQLLQKDNLPVNAYTWPSRTIPFCWDGAVTFGQKFWIWLAKGRLWLNTAVNFRRVACNAAGHKIKFGVHGGNPDSWVGLMNEDNAGNGARFGGAVILAGTPAAAPPPPGVAPASTFQLVRWNTDFSHISAAHEITHTLGFGHTHQRQDRANYITINPNGVGANWATNMGLSPTASVPGSIYDYNSIMHYSKAQSAVAYNAGTAAHVNWVNQHGFVVHNAYMGSFAALTNVNEALHPYYGHRWFTGQRTWISSGDVRVINAVYSGLPA